MLAWGHFWRASAREPATRGVAKEVPKACSLFFVSRFLTVIGPPTAALTTPGPHEE